MPENVQSYLSGTVQGTTTGTATIANGASLSDAVRVAGLTVLGIITPAALDVGSPSPITFQGSFDGVNFFNLFTTGAVEIAISTMAVSRYFILDPDLLPALAYIKVRTGTSAAPVAQTAQRLITVVLGA